MNCRWQALKFCLDAAVVVEIEIFNELPFDMLHGIKLLQIKNLILLALVRVKQSDKKSGGLFQIG